MNVFLEGYSFSGKTTLFNAISRNNDSIKAINEHDRYAKGIVNYPAFPSPTYEAAKKNVDFFFNLEQQRHQDAMEASIALFDRSIFSVILFQKYVASLKLTGHANAYVYARVEALRLIEAQLITVPDTLVCVKAGYRTITARYGREISVELLKGKEAYDFFNAQYAIIEEIYARHGLLQLIISRNDKKSVDRQAQIINQQIDTWSKSKMLNINSVDIAKEVINAI